MSQSDPLLTFNVSQWPCSVIRFLVQAILRLLVSEQHPMPEFPRHEDAEFSSPCVDVTFLWRPYAANISTELAAWARDQSNVAEIVVSGAALWDVLHVRSVNEYRDAMHATRKSLQDIFAQVSILTLACDDRELLIHTRVELLTTESACCMWCICHMSACGERHD